jgi:uncharacterized OB-fold protein
MTLTLATPGLFDETAAPGDRIRLRASRCGQCGRTEFPSRAACPSCSTQSAEVELPADAVLSGFSAVLYAPPGARVEAPYSVGVARFSDDICILGLIEGAAEDLRLGAAIETVAVAVASDLLSYGYRVT